MLNKRELLTLHATVVGMPIAIAYLFHKLGVIDLSVIFPLILPL